MENNYIEKPGGQPGEFKDGNTGGHGVQTIIIQQEKKSNGIGTAGFIMSLIAIFIGWVPFFGWFIWLLGLVFSFVGVFKKPKGMAIAGLVISLIGIILLIFVFGAVLVSHTLTR